MARYWLFGNNAGNEYLPSNMQLTSDDEAVKKRLGVSVVRNTADGTVIIKMVNLLPVPTSIKLEPGSLGAGTKTERLVLKGQPGDKEVRVQVTAMPVANELTDILAPYSFTVYKLSK